MSSNLAKLKCENEDVNKMKMLTFLFMLIKEKPKITCQRISCGATLPETEWSWPEDLAKEKSSKLEDKGAELSLSAGHVMEYRACAKNGYNLNSASGRYKSVAVLHQGKIICKKHKTNSISNNYKNIN